MLMDLRNRDISPSMKRISEMLSWHILSTFWKLKGYTGEIELKSDGPSLGEKILIFFTELLLRISGIISLPVSRQKMIKFLVIMRRRL
jgi:hypothetical protein